MHTIFLVVTIAKAYVRNIRWYRVAACTPRPSAQNVKTAARVAERPPASSRPAWKRTDLRMLRAPRYLRIRVLARNADRAEHRARAILFLTIVAALILLFVLLTAVRHAGL